MTILLPLPSRDGCERIVELRQLRSLPIETGQKTLATVVVSRGRQFLTVVILLPVVVDEKPAEEA